MDKAMWDKIAAAGGLIGAVLFVVGALIFGDPPDVTASASSVADFYTDNRGQVLWGTFFQGLGVIAIIWFFAALTTAMRAADEARLATATAMGFVLAFAIGAVSLLVRTGLAFTVAQDADAELVQAVHNTGVYLDLATGLIAAAFYLAVGGAIIRSGMLASWWGWVSTVVGLWSIVASTGWGRDGFWSPDGVGLVNFVVFLVWLAVTSILLTMRAPTRTSAT